MITPNVAHYVPDLMAERTLVAVNRQYYTWVLLGLLVPAAIGEFATGNPWGRAHRDFSGVAWCACSWSNRRCRR